MLAFIDKYLDVMLTTSGDILVDDKEELDAAYRSGEFTEEQYETALLEGERIIDEWGRDIHATELLCKEMLNYLKAQVNSQPLTVFLDIDGVLNVYQPDLEVQTLLPYAGENICELIHRMKAKVVVISSHRLGGINWDILLDAIIYMILILPHMEKNIIAEQRNYKFNEFSFRLFVLLYAAQMKSPSSSNLEENRGFAWLFLLWLYIFRTGLTYFQNRLQSW